MLENVGFGAFFKCYFFFEYGAIWTMLVAYRIVMLLDEFQLGFWEYWYCEKICVVDLDEYIHDACGESLLACVNFVL